MPKKILVVDDDESILKVFEYGLQDAGYVTITVPNGFDAIEKVKKERYDLVFLDVRMPRLNGVETFKMLKKIDPQIMAVMMTGYRVDALLKEAFEMGAHACIYKPFEMEEILSIIQKILQEGGRRSS
jgi:DNA-binding NtrC family response regulator